MSTISNHEEDDLHETKSCATLGDISKLQSTRQLPSPSSSHPSLRTSITDECEDSNVVDFNTMNDKALNVAAIDETRALADDDDEDEDEEDVDDRKNRRDEEVTDVFGEENEANEELEAISTTMMVPNVSRASHFASTSLSTSKSNFLSAIQSSTSSFFTMHRFKRIRSKRRSISNMASYMHKAHAKSFAAQSMCAEPSLVDLVAFRTKLATSKLLTTTKRKYSRASLFFLLFFKSFLFW